MWAKWVGDKVVNRKAVLILLGALVVLGVGSYLAHAFQVSRSADGLVVLAADLEQQGQTRAAADCLRYYLGLYPRDAEARARFGLLLTRAAQTRRERQQALQVLEHALRDDGRRADLRREAAKLATSLGRYTDARDHLQVLLNPSPNDAGLLTLLGRCQVGLGGYETARKTLEKAVEKAPKQVEASEVLADLLRQRLGLPENADKVINDLASHGAADPRACLAAARYYARLDNWKVAEQHLRPALELAPDDADVLLLASAVARAGGHPALARRHLEHAVKCHPTDARVALALARAELPSAAMARAILAPLRQTPPERRDELLELGDLLIECGELDGAARTALHLEVRRYSAEAGYLRAHLLAARGRWREARAALERLAAQQLATPMPARQVFLLLADCHEQFHNPDARLTAIKRALEIDPRWPAARFKLALCWLSLGQADRAAVELEAVAARVPEARLQLARLQLGRNLRLPPEAQRWGDVKRLLEAAAAAGPSGEANLLRVEVLLAQGKRDEARKLAAAERDRDPSREAPWLQLARAARSDKASLDVLDEAERRVGPRAAWHLARATYWNAAGSDGTPKLLELAARANVYDGADRDLLLGGLAEIFAARGEPHQARPLWRRLASNRPDDVGVRLLLLESAMQAGRDVEARLVAKEIKRLDGPDGLLTAYADAVCRVAPARRGGRADLAGALPLAQRVTAERPSWPRGPLLLGTIHELMGRPEQALEQYQAALERGEARVVVVQHVVELLDGAGRPADADALLRRLPESAFAQADL
jgi:tetratricopeptide (TPR) repeat protein